tara:strand:+ start:64 stop:336 length:273 start_codon:yes stop_codon:yes gene_type:complete
MKTKIAETMGTPIACGNPSTRLLKMVVAIESVKTAVKACKRKKLPILPLVITYHAQRFFQIKLFGFRGGIRNSSIYLPSITEVEFLSKTS